MWYIYIILPYIEKLESSRDVLLSNYLMSKYGSVHSLEVLNGGGGDKEEVITTEDHDPLRVVGWRVLTVITEH